MDSESSQDTFFFFKDGEKDLMAYEEEDMLALEAGDLDMEDRSETVISGNNTSARKEEDFSVLMSTCLEADEPDELLMPPVGAATPQPEEIMEIFETPGVDFNIQDGAALPISRVSLPSPKVLPSGGDLASDIQNGAAKSPSILPDVENDPAAPQNEASESGDHTDEISNEPSQPPKAAKPDEGHCLHLFHTDQTVFHAISIRENPDPSENRVHDRMIQEHFAFNRIDIACQLLEAAAAQMEPKVIVNESTVMAIANGLQLSMDYGTGVEYPQIGRLVADLLLDSQTGLVLGFAVARLVPHPIINSSGAVQGSVLHQVIRGFAIDDNSRRIISEAVGSAIMAVNKISIE